MNRDYRLKVSLSKRIQLCCSHTSFTDKVGNPLSSRNNETTRRVLELWTRMCVDVLLSVTSVEVVNDVCSSWLSSQPQTININTWISALETMADQFIHAEPFKLKGSDSVCRWLERLFRSKYIRFMSSRRDVYNLLRFPKRITLRNVDDLEEATRDAFFSNVERVEKLNVDGDYTDSESLWIQEWLEDYTPPVLADCYHSGGSTADRRVGRHVKEKYAYLDEDPYTWAFCIKNRIPVVKLHSGEFLSTHILQELKQGNRIIPTSDAYRPSRVQFVPKSYKTYRSVAMEHHTRMFYQNGVSHQLRKCIERKLSQHIDLEDQERSRELALEASSNKKFATIDFSMASDSLSFGLFMKWFGHTRFGEDAMLLRGRSFTYKDKEYDNPIAFTMGAPLCFPVECLVFLAMAYATIEAEGGDPRTETILVYGDDVILPAQYAEAFMRRAIRNGFLPNADKSYWQQACCFREACGMEAYDGVDITPMYVARGFTGSVQTSQSSYVHMANAAYGRGYFGVYKRLVDYLNHDRIRVFRVGHIRPNGKRKNYVRKEMIKSFATYSDDLNVLKDESSTYVFNPNADELNRKNKLTRRLKVPYNSPDIKIYRTGLKVIDTMTYPHKGKGLSQELEERARLDFRLHYKPMHKTVKYGTRCDIARAMIGDQSIYRPELILNLEHTITHLSVTVR